MRRLLSSTALLGAPPIVAGGTGGAGGAGGSGRSIPSVGGAGGTGGTGGGGGGATKLSIDVAGGFTVVLLFCASTHITATAIHVTLMIILFFINDSFLD